MMYTIATFGPSAASYSAASPTSMMRTPTERIAWSYSLRDAFGITTSSFAKPVRSGMRTCRSGFPPVTQAAVVCAIPAAQPAETRAHSAPVSSARRRGRGFHQLVQHDMMLPAGIHRGADLRQFERAADDRQRPAAVDQRADADGLVDLRPELKFSGGDRRGGGCACATPLKSAGAVESIPPLRNNSRRLRLPSTLFIESNMRSLPILDRLIISQPRVVSDKLSAP